MRNLVLLFVLITSAIAQSPGPNTTDEKSKNDGMLGIIPELFEESNDAEINFYSEDSVKEFLALCSNATKCEDCPDVFKNSKMLKNFKGECDELSRYNFDKLRLAQSHIRTKHGLVTELTKSILYLVLYGICLLLGIYLLIVRQFRVRTLWDRYAHDPTQGMRSFRYERMQFKFDYQDPGANPEDLTGYEDWEVYHSSDDEDMGKHFNAMGTVGPEQAILKKKKQAEREMKEREKGSKFWPWEAPDYNFSRIPYREGLRKDADEGKDT